MWEVGNWVVPGVAGARDGRLSVRSNPQRRKGMIRRGNEKPASFCIEHHGLAGSSLSTIRYNKITKKPSSNTFPDLLSPLSPAYSLLVQR